MDNGCRCSSRILLRILQLFSSNDVGCMQGRIALGLMGAIIPGVWGTSLMALRLLDFPQEQSGSWPFIGLLIASSWVFGYLNARIANFSVRELWLTEGGSHVRIRTFRIFGVRFAGREKYLLLWPRACLRETLSALLSVCVFFDFHSTGVRSQLDASHQGSAGAGDG